MASSSADRAPQTWAPGTPTHRPEPAVPRRTVPIRQTVARSVRRAGETDRVTGPPASRLLGGRWLLKEMVGDQGGMSEVYRAFDTKGVHNVVAAKLLPLPLQHDKWNL